MDPPPFASVGTSNQQVDPWNYLLKEVIQILETSELQAVLNYMQGAGCNDDDDDGGGDDSVELSEDEKVKHMFLKKMNEGTNFRDTTRRLQKAFDFLKFHEQGVKLSSIVNDFLTKYYPEDEEQQETIIGRDEEIRRITKAITEGGSKCVIISGPGGQGKTTLAKHVCQKLNWPCTFTVDMRDKSSISALAKAILLNNREMVSSSEEKVIKDLKIFLKDLQVDALIFVDHCDLMFKDDNKDKVDSFFDEILSFLEQDLYVKVRFLMTSVIRFDPHQEETAKLVTQIELHSLEKPAAVELLCKSSGEEMPQMMAEEIVTACACSPLAVTTVASMIRDKKFTVRRLLFHLKMDEKNVTEALQVSNCLKVAIGSLEEDVKESLYRLVVFQGSSFKSRFVEKVLKGPESSKHLSILKILKKAHLLDCRQSLKSEFDPDYKGRREIYSLQPLVYKYLHESLKKGQLSSIEDAVTDAKRKFLELYEGEISNLMYNMDTRIVKGMKSLEFHKTHIKKYFSILENEKPVLKPYPIHSKAKDFLKKKRMFELADLLIPDVQKRRLYKSEAARAKSDGNSAMCILWTVEEAEVYLLSADKPSLAKDLLDRLSENYPALQGLRNGSVYPHLVHALFHRAKGLTLWKLQKPQDGIQHLLLALEFYEHFNTTSPEKGQRCDKNYVCLHARVYSAIGQIYIELENFDAAWQALEKGKSMIKKILESQVADSEMQRDIPRFYTKFGHILLKKAQIENDPKQRAEYLNDALEQLNKGMSIDRKLKMDNFELYNVKQKLKADVLIEKGDYEQALKEAEAALDLRRAILQPPHFKYLESVYQVARIYLLTGNTIAEKDAGKEEARKWWLTARDYFTEMEEHHLVNGSIKVGHPLLDEIKRDHLEVRRLYDGENSESVKEVVEFYQKLERGEFKSRADSHLKSFQAMLRTPEEFVKQLFGPGGEQFGTKEIRMEDPEKDPCEQIERMRDGSFGVEIQDSDSSLSSKLCGSVSSEESVSNSSHTGPTDSASLENKGCKRTATSVINEDKEAKRQKTLTEDK